MQSDIKPSRCTAKRQFAKGEQRNIIDFLKASITTDNIKIFSITFCTLVTVYCTCKIAKDAFRIVLYVTTFLHCSLFLRCSLFRFAREWGESRSTCLLTCLYPTGYDQNPCLLHNAILHTTLFKIYANLLGTFLRKMVEISARKRVEYGV